MEAELTHAKLFFLASDLGAGDAVGQLALLACGLPRDRFAVAIGTLCRADAPAADALRAAGLSVVSLPIKHPLDFSGMRRLRNVIREAASVVAAPSMALAFT